jgi:hypothetical protein
VHARRSRVAAAARAPAPERLRHGRFSFCVAWLKCKVETAREALAGDGRERGRSSPSTVREARCGACRSVAWFGVGGGGSDPLWAIRGSTTTSLDARACLGRSKWQGGMERTGGPFGVRRPDAARREEGVDSEAASVGAWPGEGRPRDAGGPRRRGAVRRARARRRRSRRGATSRRPGKILQCPCLNASNSKKLNRSAQNNE